VTEPAPVARLAAALAVLVPEGRLAVAVSGGPDSLALLWLVSAARPGGVVAATVDHGLRAGAAAEAGEVARVAAGLGVPHGVLPVAVVPAGEGMQAAARQARYAALAAWATTEGAAALATAHHADDQAETLLMRAARGSGLGGLAGVRRSRPLAGNVRLVRPLLDWRKAELAAVVAAAGLSAADDPSNRDPAHDRTAFRDLLAREPRLDPLRLATTAANLAEAEEALAWTAERLWRERMSEGVDGLVLDLAGLPPELERRLLARALPGARGSAVAALRRRLASQPAATLGDRLVRREGSRWRIGPAPPRT
jgi:tRNA(Ile)-lysidine synthase